MNRRGRRNTQRTTQHGVQKPQNGAEFYFSNVMVKVYQVPLLFSRSSDETNDPFEGAFICLIFEKLTRKRAAAKTQTHFDKLARAAAIKKKYDRKYEEELV